MSDTGHEHSMRIEMIEGQDFSIRVSMGLPSDETRWVPHGERPSLAMDPSRPTRVGWRWPPARDVGDPMQPSSDPPPIRLYTDQRSIRFSYSFDSENTCTLALADAHAALFPIGESSYAVDVEIDPATHTIWFSLPEGRCIYDLEVSFNLDMLRLNRFVAEWFADRDEESPLPFAVVDDGHYDDEACYQHCFSKTTETMETVDIPAELLRDPIRNGSKYLEHGFNPWNQDQQARIVAHLERELARLTDLFRRDASLSPAEVSASGA